MTERAPVLVDFDRYHLPSRITEAQLLGTPLMRTEACSCGGSVTAADADAAILAAVQTHNATPAHRAWRSGRSPLSSPTTGDATVDLSRGYPTRPAGEGGA